MANLSDKISQGVVPVKDFTKRTKQISLTTEVSGTNWTTERAVFIFYADSNGIWRARFNISGDLGGSTVNNFSGNIADVTFKADYDQSLSADVTDVGIAAYATVVARAKKNSGVFNIAAASVFDNVQISGDVELESEPTAYTAGNMENDLVISAVIPDATDTDKGIVSLSSEFAATSEKYGLVGGSNGVAAPTGQIGEVINGTHTGATLAVTNVAYNVSTLVLDKGTFQVFGIAGCGTAGTTRSRFLSGISETSGTNPLSADQNKANLAYENANIIQSAIMPIIYNITSSKTLYLVANSLFTGTAPAVLSSNVKFYAVRIG